MSKTTLFLISILMFVLWGCDHDFVVQQTPQRPENIALEVSYNETATRSQPQGPGIIAMSLQSQQSGANRSGGRLLDFEKARRLLRIRTDGSVYAEKQCLEGNSDIRIPMKLHNEIKGQMHPADPGLKPIVRWVFDGGIMTAFAETGEAVFSQTFPAPTAAGGSNQPGGKNLGKLLPEMIVRTSRNDLMRFDKHLENSGIAFTRPNPGEVIFEEFATLPGGVVKKMKRVDAQTGFVNASVTYNSAGQVLEVAKFAHKNVSGMDVAVAIQRSVYGDKGDGEWGILWNELVSRTDVSVYVKPQ